MTAKDRPVTGPGPDAAPGDLLLVNKPAGWTSFDVVNKIRRASGIRKVGHAGTLDPLATGLLIICTGPRTRELQSFTGLDKEYRVTMRLGERTASFDAATPVIERRETSDITEERIRGVLAEFVGPQRQIPPMYSAVKVGGRRLYTLARKGVEVAREAREIEIRSMRPVTVNPPDVTFDVECSKGTYVRTLVEDIGLRLGCGAHVTALERTRIGPYRLADARQLDDLVRAFGAQGERAA
jgi:tRNA pseudouridine55 synthase